MNYDKNRSLSQLRVIPRLVRVGVAETVIVSPIGRAKAFDDETEYSVYPVPMELYSHDRLGETTAWDCIKVYPNNGTITFSYTFDEEQEWLIMLIPDASNGKKLPNHEIRLYALEDDLYERDPYLGDLHAHSCRSDGREDPAIVAANYRKEGYDFLSLTDHGKWAPSVEMQEAYQDLPLGIRLFRGEEVHVPSGWLHVVSFGGDYSVQELYRSNAEALTKQMQAEAEAFDAPRGINALEYVWRRWIANEIRRSGGLCIIPHPYWIYKQTYHMSSRMLEYVFETGIYDAFELVGGQSVHENNVQISFYQEMRAKGKSIPVVGSSDSHGTDPVSYFGIGKTVVLAKKCDKEGICEAIRSGYSAAIEQQKSEEERVYGSYRMVKYVRFLLDQYFPSHDELCVEEGILMREYAMGIPSAEASLRALAGRVDAHRRYVLRGEAANV